jgi:predicted lipoprotein with Yx(FWY)xxD motif
MTPAFTRIFATMALASIAAIQATNASAESRVLTSRMGMTVYTFDEDTSAKSHCYGPCASVWLPVRPGEVSGSDLCISLRDDATLQVALKGKPIYLFAGDQKAGDMKGDNLDQVWHVARSHE